MKSPSSGPSTRSSGRRLGRDHVYLDLPRAERRGDLEPDEARADNDRAAWPPPRRLDDRATVGQGAQVVNGRAGLAGHREPNRIGAGGEEERAELPCRSVIEGEALPARSSAVTAATHELHPRSS